MDYINTAKEFIEQHKKVVIISAIATILLTIIILILTAFRPYITNSGTLYLNVVPHDALITINGESFTNGSHNIKAGNYTVEISKDDFEPKTTEVMIEVAKDTIVSIALEPVNEDNTWYLDHPEDDEIYTQISDQNAEITQAEFVKKFPIMNHIPYNETSDDKTKNNRFKIDAVYDYESVSLLITLNTCSDYSAEIYKQAALDWLNSINVDLSQYTIEFTTICG